MCLSIHTEYPQHPSRFPRSPPCQILGSLVGTAGIGVRSRHSGSCNSRFWLWWLHWCPLFLLHSPQFSPHSTTLSALHYSLSTLHYSLHNSMLNNESLHLFVSRTQQCSKAHVACLLASSCPARGGDMPPPIPEAMGRKRMTIQAWANSQTFDGVCGDTFRIGVG